VDGFVWVDVDGDDECGGALSEAMMLFYGFSSAACKIRW
jgi:hypothetical protein